MRSDSRAPDEPRKARITTPYLSVADGSVLMEMGNTRVICAATVEERVPGFLRGEGKGWITAEYGMLPRSTLVRTPREKASGRTSGRVLEIQRLIGRSLRSVANLEALKSRTVVVDCDVLQADGGTRTAAITGAYVAMYQALVGLVRNNVLAEVPLTGVATAISVGVVDGVPLLDLCYEEDFRATVDFNVVMTEMGELIEVQGTAEGAPFSRRTMDDLLSLAQKGVNYLLGVQREAIEGL